MIASVIRSANGKFLKKETSKKSSKDNPIYENHVLINPLVTYQTHLGFGGAITEASAYTMSEQMKNTHYQEVINAYFSKQGLNYNLVRLHMNSCDFSLENYSYVQTGDRKLETFDISREERWVLPFVKEALLRSDQLKILISPWSPPAYMKTNNDMNHGGKLLAEFRNVWAQYYVKFIQELNKRNIDVWALTVQNEPAAVQTWDSCIYSAQEEGDFIKNHLGPALNKSGLNDIKVLIWDHNLDIILERAVPILSDDQASQYVWGTAFHWYVAEVPENLSKLHALFPDKHLLFTEGCIEGGPRPGAWDTGERYARNIINDFNHGCEGFIDWNLVLNEQGGPNHVGNYCDAPILADRPNQRLIYNSSYYFIWHFSRYIEPGSVRVAQQATLVDGLRLVTYRTPDDKLIVVTQNETNDDQAISYEIDRRRFVDQLPSHSITTYVIPITKNMKKLYGSTKRSAVK